MKIGHILGHINTRSSRISPTNYMSSLVLYPSLEAIQVADIVYKAVMETEIEFKNINYQEGVRYIALTSTAQECRIGPLKRVLPRRRHGNGVRPGVTGVGPAGAAVGLPSSTWWPDQDGEETDCGKGDAHGCVNSIKNTLLHNWGQLLPTKAWWAYRP